MLTRFSTPLGRGSNCQGSYDILFDFQDVVFQSPQQCQITSDEIGSHPKLHANEISDENFRTIHLEEENFDKDLEGDIEKMEKMIKKFEKQPTVYLLVDSASVQWLLRDVKCEKNITCLEIVEPKTKLDV